MRDDEQDPGEEITSAQALASALQYLLAEARIAGFHFVAHLIEAATTAIEEDLKNSHSGDPAVPCPRTWPPKLRLLQGGKAESDVPDKRGNRS